MLHIHHNLDIVGARCFGQILLVSRFLVGRFARRWVLALYDMRVIICDLCLDVSFSLAESSCLGILFVWSHAFYVSEMTFISRQTFPFGIMLFNAVNHVSLSF
jgi:hypothetical protein